MASSFAWNRKKEFALKNLIKRFLSDQSGATAIEYGLIAAGIALAIITAVTFVTSKYWVFYDN